MYNNMIANPSLQALSTPQAGDFLAAAGVINPDSDVAGFSYLRRLDNVVNVPALLPGDYSLRLLDEDDNLLAEYAFTPELSDDTGMLGFGLVVDFMPGTRQVQIVRTTDDEVLGSQAISANPPEISNVALQGAPDPVVGVVTLGWTASDLDNDSLTFDVVYSLDNGANFQPVAAGLSGTITEIDTASLGGSGTAILRVIATDGVNSAYADSAPFVMAPKPPQPFIFTPGDDLHIHYGQLVNFSGFAQDVQDGTVADAGLLWWDENLNLLGSGPLLSLDSLPVGENEITFQAINSLGETAYTSVTVFVDDDLSLPGPTLTAGPSPVSWHVSAGSTDVQSVEISINNSGSGDLDWTVSEDATWLTSSVISGTVTADGDASTLVLSADPSGLAEGATYSTSLTISMPASGTSPAQSVVIPVALSIGDVRSATASENKIFLPTIIR